MNSSRRVDSCEIAIVGGGLTGASLACALAPLGLDVTLLEAVSPHSDAQPSYDDRTLALSAASCRILEGLDIWPRLAGDAAAIREIEVRELGRPGWVVLRAAELGLPAFGQVVEARRLGQAVMAQLQELPSVRFICPAEVRSLDCGEQVCRIGYFAGGTECELEARLLVGADGAESAVREALGIDIERHDYGQTAIVCNVTPSLPHRGRAFEHFTPTGPFALLPHVGQRCGLVWSVANDEAAAMLEWEDEAFRAAAELRFGDFLGPWRKIGKRSAYPLRLVRAQTDIAGRAVLLGNAAHAIHPIGAQGFNLGLRDVAALAEILADSLIDAASAARMFDSGSAGALETYSAWRAPDQAGTIGYTDGLARIYANPTRLAALGRQAGLLAHALIPPLRRRLAIRAMGYRGRVPRLAMGERLRTAERGAKE